MLHGSKANVRKIVAKEKTRSQFGRASSLMQYAPWFTDAGRMQRLVRFAEIQKDSRVLDIACGTGVLSAYLCKLGTSVTGIDITPAMLAYAKRNCAECAFICADAESLPFTTTSGKNSSKLFDLCITRACIHHIQNIKSLLREIRRVSNVLIIEDTSSSENPAEARLHNLLEKMRDPSHNWMHSLSELRRIIESEGYTVEKLEVTETNREFEDWMSVAVVDSKTRARCRALLIDSIKRGRDDTGLNVKVKNGKITFTHKRFLLKASCA